MKIWIYSLISLFWVSIVHAADPINLVSAHPEQLEKIEGNELVWKDGTRMVISDGSKKETFDEMLNQPSLEYQLSQTYPVGAELEPVPAKDSDPGRIRYEPFFRKMYGDTASDVEKNLRTIQWMPNTYPQKLRVTTVNGVDKRLERISEKLEALSDELKIFGAKLGGGFYWRKISGTSRLSAHSFGIAIDLNTDKSDYWRWVRRKVGEVAEYHNQVPLEIVKLFEEEGFIWGGRWYHFDTMHFEYRPELIKKSDPGSATE